MGTAVVVAVLAAGVMPVGASAPRVTRPAPADAACTPAVAPQAPGRPTTLTALGPPDGGPITTQSGLSDAVDLTGDGVADRAQVVGGSLEVAVGGPGGTGGAVGWSEPLTSSLAVVDLVPVGDRNDDGAGDLAVAYGSERSAPMVVVHAGRPCRDGTGGATVPAPRGGAVLPDASTEGITGTVGRPPSILQDAPDPHIVREGLTYYAYTTNTPNWWGTWNLLPVWRSTDLDTWTLVGDGLRDAAGRPTVGAWANPDGLTWAPSVERLGGRWVLHYTSRHRASNRQCIGVATSASPTGPFVDNAGGPIVCQTDRGGSIDAAVFTDDGGTPWLLWKNDGNCCGFPTQLWSAPMSTDGRSIAGGARPLLTRDRAWEGPLIEGPAMARGAGRTWLAYSAGWWEGANYATGIAECPGPAGGCTKRSTAGPWHASNEHTLGPGGASFLADARGGTWMAHHGWVGAVGYAAWGWRAMYIERVDLERNLPVVRDSAPHDEVLSPLGAIESVSNVGVGVARVQGWAGDPEGDGPVTVDVRVDGVPVPATVANLARPGLGALYPPWSDAHGFDVSVSALGSGVHSVCVRVRNLGRGADTDLGCRSVAIGGAPFGNLEGISVSGPGVATASGWAIDPDAVDPIQVHVYAVGPGGVRSVGVVADGSRSDVGAAYPGFGMQRGYSAELTGLPGGTHSVCAYAINVAAGSNRAIGCRDVVIAADPIGSFESAKVAGPGSVEVGGWALDPETAQPIPVHVYATGPGGVRSVGTTAADDRPDVGAAYPGWGPRHGFRTTLAGLPAGAHSICAFAINVGAGGHRSLGCRWVVVPGPNPIGNLESVRSVVPGAIAVSGWALDPDVASPIDVHVYASRTGFLSGIGLTASGPRADVGAAYVGFGDAHGFSGGWSGLAAGTYDVCAYGINVGPGGHSTLGCRRVAVG
jgi:hypothetical protein